MAQLYTQYFYAGLPETTPACGLQRFIGVGGASLRWLQTSGRHAYGQHRGAAKHFKGAHGAP